MRILIFFMSLLAAATANAQATPEDKKLVHAVRFTDYELGPIEDWLQGKGFKFQLDAKRRDRIDFDVGSTGLVLEAKRRAFGVMPNDSVNVPTFTHVEIDWGVNKFPAGASYEQGIRNVGLMVIVFMGDERQLSGSMLIPDSPYFVGLFPCHGDAITSDFGNIVLRFNALTDNGVKLILVNASK